MERMNSYDALEQQLFTAGRGTLFVLVSISEQGTTNSISIKLDFSHFLATLSRPRVFFGGGFFQFIIYASQFCVLSFPVVDGLRFDMRYEDM